jgi:hypothetical protein
VEDVVAIEEGRSRGAGETSNIKEATEEAGTREGAGTEEEGAREEITTNRMEIIKEDTREGEGTEEATRAEATREGVIKVVTRTVDTMVGIVLSNSG